MVSVAESPTVVLLETVAEILPCYFVGSGDVVGEVAGIGSNYGVVGEAGGRGICLRVVSAVDDSGSG